MHTNAATSPSVPVLNNLNTHAQVHAHAHTLETQTYSSAHICVPTRLHMYTHTHTHTHTHNIQGRLEAGLLYTSSYLRNIKAVLRGALRGVSEPTTMTSVVKVGVAGEH